jgi:diaminopimelate epimerase
MAKRNRTVSFHKMHSLGNDFMVFDGVSQHLNLSPEQIGEWGDRHRGIGFDQLLVIEAPTDPEADFSYRIFNADGSEAEQCGNGSRCVTMLARDLKLSKKSELVWQSSAGVFRTVYTSASQIETEMTVPVLEHSAIPFTPTSDGTANGTGSSTTVTAGDDEFSITAVSMGNPHAVLFVDDIVAATVQETGARLTRHEAFPRGTNVGFCQIVDPQFMRLRVFERGVGETLACGSGACAAVVAARLNDLVDERVKVSLPGGKLRIAWPGPGTPVTMSGPATHVFRGELTIPA